MFSSQFWLAELPESLDAYAGRVFSAAFFASFWDLCESSQHLADVRASLSTWQSSCKYLVSTGAGLPTQWDSCCLCLWLVFVAKDMFLEFGSFSHCHRPQEGLHLSHLHLNRLLVGGLWTVSSIVSFLFASVACSSCVYRVFSSRCVSSFCGTRSTGRHVSR